jgi:hypothetical protein
MRVFDITISIPSIKNPAMHWDFLNESDIKLFKSYIKNARLESDAMLSNSSPVYLITSEGRFQLRAFIKNKIKENCKENGHVNLKVPLKGCIIDVVHHGSVKINGFILDYDVQMSHIKYRLTKLAIMILKGLGDDDIAFGTMI